MLSLQMKSGDYLTIGENIVVQIFKESGPQFRVSVKAPREVSIVRGKVLERKGEHQPNGLRSKGPKTSPSDKLRSARYLQKVSKRQETRKLEQALCLEAIKGLEQAIGQLKPSPERAGLEQLQTQMTHIVETWEKLNQGVFDAPAETASDGVGESA